MKKLKEPEAGLEKFFGRADALREKMGPVLWQLPPQWEKNVERLEHFLRVLPQWRQHAFEFRNATWNSGEVFALLRSYNAAFCMYHLAGYESPREITADWSYIRLHGPGAKYQGSYADDALGAWAERIGQWRASLRAIYVYFDNDEGGFAPRDAHRLREMVQRPAYQS